MYTWCENKTKLKVTSNDCCHVLASNEDCSSNIQVHYLICCQSVLVISYVRSIKPWASETDFRLFHRFYWDLQLQAVCNKIRNLNAVPRYRNYLWFLCKLPKKFILGWNAFVTRWKCMETTYSSEKSLTFTGLHGVVSQKIELFLTTAVRSSDPTI
jgi:hypothetical protein